MGGSQSHFSFHIIVLHGKFSLPRNEAAHRMFTISCIIFVLWMHINVSSQHWDYVVFYSFVVLWRLGNSSLQKRGGSPITRPLYNAFKGFFIGWMSGNFLMLMFLAYMSWVFKCSLKESPSIMIKLVAPSPWLFSYPLLFIRDKSII